MKSIELTKEHKSKLLEMCNKLFPEYSVWTFEETSQLGAYCYDYNCLLFSNEAKNHLYKAESIHWFEFCMTHLAEKIFKHDESFYDYLLTSWTEVHPIDYLYKEFKEN